MNASGNAESSKRPPFPSVPELCAVSYLKLGWAPIPVAGHGKTPLVEWKTYQHRLPTVAEVRGWFTRWPEANVGIVTGGISGLVVVDLDSLEAVREFRRRWGNHPLSTPVVRTGRGVQIYYRHPGSVIPNRAGLLPGMDVR